MDAKNWHAPVQTFLCSMVIGEDPFSANPSFLQSFGQNGRCRKYIDATQDKNDMELDIAIANDMKK